MMPCADHHGRAAGPAAANRPQRVCPVRGQYAPLLSPQVRAPGLLARDACLQRACLVQMRLLSTATLLVKAVMPMAEQGSSGSRLSMPGRLQTLGHLADVPYGLCRASHLCTLSTVALLAEAVALMETHQPQQLSATCSPQMADTLNLQDV